MSLSFSVMVSTAIWQSLDRLPRLRNPWGRPFSTWRSTYEQIYIEILVAYGLRKSTKTLIPAATSLLVNATVSSRQGSTLVEINVVGGKHENSSGDARRGDSSGSE